MVSITGYGGIGEIGGNKLLLEDRKSRIFLDFGQSFSLLDEYFVREAYLLPRGRFGLRDYFAFDLLPKLKGLYSRDSLEKTDFAFTPAEYDGVLLSHAHFDHFEHLKFLNPEIPVHMGEAARLILLSMQETAGEKGVKYIRPDSKVSTFRTGKDFTVGEFKVHPVHVDHSVPGAYGFIIETSEGNIAYSGDLRKHGPRADMTDDFLKKAAEFDPVLFIVEGTRVAEKETRKNHTEQYVQEQSLKIAQETKGLIMATRYPKDIDRFRTFYSIAKASGKELVITMKTAHLLLSLKEDPIELPDPYTDDTLRIFGREKLIYQNWEQKMLPRCVDSAYIAEHQDEIVLELEFFQLPELIDIKPRGGACIHSMSEPFEEDPLSQLSDTVLHNWLNAFHMQHHQLHASGHASMGEIFQFVEQVNAEKVLPVHTIGGQLFTGDNVIHAKKGQKITI